MSEHSGECNTTVRLIPSDCVRVFQLYRTLWKRHKNKPLYLNRTLSYVRHNLRRPKRNSRRNFNINGMLDERLKQPPSDNDLDRFMTITFLGFYNPTLPSDGESTVHVETCILKVDSTKRITAKGSVIKANVGSAAVPLNPKLDDRGKVPVLSIAPEAINGGVVRGRLVKKRLLLLRVTSDKLPPFEATYDVFDKAGRLLLEDSIYELAAEGGSCPTPWIKTGSTAQTNLELLKQKNCHQDGPRITFKIEWTRKNFTGWAFRSLVTPGIKKENNQIVKKEPDRPKILSEYTISFFFEYDKTYLETKEEIGYCPFCRDDFRSLYRLLKHLKLWHERFSFTYTKKEKHICVKFAINPDFKSTYEGNPMHPAGAPRDVVCRRTPSSTMLVCRPRRMKPGLSEFLTSEELDVQRTLSWGHNRLYYHTTTWMPINPREMDYDSESERDPEWLRTKTKMMIDEFTDVNEGEKEILKLWNLHVLKYGFVGVCQVPLALKMFIEEQGENVIKGNLIRNFQLHMANLVENDMLAPVNFLSVMKLLREKLRENSQAKIFANAWMNQTKSWLASGGAGGPRDKSSSSAKTYEPCSKVQSQSSTFIAGDGTLRRKMTVSPKKDQRPKDGVNEDDKPIKQRFRNDPPMKKSARDDRELRKRKLSLQDKTDSDDCPAKRARAGSDPAWRK